MRILWILPCALACVTDAPMAGQAQLAKIDLSCEVPDTPPENPRLVTSCVDDVCSGLRVTVDPPVGPLVWVGHGDVLGEGCAVDVALKPGERMSLFAKGPDGQTFTQGMVTLDSDIEPQENGGGLPETITYGDDGDCARFWITQVGGCVSPTIGTVRFRAYLRTATSSPTLQSDVILSTNPRGVLQPGYADAFRWTPNDNYDLGEHPAGQVPGANAQGTHLTHWFELQPGRFLEVRGRHGGLAKWHDVDTFWCSPNGTPGTGIDSGQ